MLAVVGIVVAGLPHTSAEEAFYRITSTEQTRIVALDATGMLEWTNSASRSVCAIQRTPQLGRTWEPYLDPVIVTSGTGRVLLPISTSEPVTRQKLLFEFTHVGGWGFGCGGIYVDNCGFAYTYYHPNPGLVDPTNGVFSSTFLSEKTASNRMYLTTIERPQLENMWNLLSLAATGSVSATRQIANDLGVDDFRGFLLNDASNGYDVVLLAKGGDLHATNSAPEAGILVNWLGSLLARIPEGGFIPRSARDRP